MIARQDESPVPDGGAGLVRRNRVSGSGVGEGLLVEVLEDVGRDGGGVRVVEELVLVVAEGDAAVSGIDEVVGVEWDFSAAAGAVDDELRDGVAGGVAAEAFDDGDAFGDGGAEVGRAVDEVALIEVVRPDAAHEELVDEGFLDIDVVVDAAEEDGLVTKGDAGVGEACECVADFGGEFAGVVGVDGDEEGVVL